MRYFANLSAGKIVLWCFLLWYLATVIHHFDATPAIWLNAFGISALIACAAFVCFVLAIKRFAPRTA